VGHPDEHGTVADAALPAELIGHVIFPLFVVERIDQNLPALRQRFHGITKLLGHLAQKARATGSACPPARASR
jgi:hypothetical protein